MSLLFLALELLAVLTALLASRLLKDGGPGDLTDAQVDARRGVGKALDALGGLGSPAGSCVWHVVGLERSLRKCALRQVWERSYENDQRDGGHQGARTSRTPTPAQPW